ncbi:potassium channel family protein [Amycolatopsis methanolica]|uniref:potassium channel family protein n=1 Tax=Amycolatopsis methanolica TaxID=1814 RepID=UPI0034179AD9
MTPGVGERVRAHRGRFLVLGVLRPSLTVVLLVTAYYVLPVGDRVRGGGAVFLAAGLAVVTAVVVWEVRAILRSPYPLLQGVQALALVVPLFLLLFAGAYHSIEQVRPGSFTGPLSKTDALYFVVTVFATVGFGDITPVAEPVRILVTVQMLGDLLLLGLGLRVILTAVRHGRDRTEKTGGDDDRDRDLRARDDR